MEIRNRAAKFALKLPTSRIKVQGVILLSTWGQYRLHIKLKCNFLNLCILILKDLPWKQNESN